MTVTVRTDERGPVLHIELNRPASMNAIDGDMAAGLIAAFRRLDERADLRVGVLSGAGSNFCSGMDLKDFAVNGPPRGLDELLRRGSIKPLVAAVEGIAMGGGLELALLCDLIVVADGARIALPEVRVGLFAAGGGVRRLPGRVGHAAAARMIFTGRSIDAAEAAEIGLASASSDAGGALDHAMELAGEIAGNGPLAVQASKALLGMDRAPDDDFYEAQLQLAKRVFRSEDAKEGPRAFAEKREAAWQAR